MRVFDRRQLMAIDGAGVDGVVREVFESSVAMGLTALRYLDVDPREMEDVEATLRHLDETRLQAQIDEGDISAGMDHRFKPGGGREADSVLEKFRRKRLEAKAAREEDEAMGLKTEG
jgi:CPA2 family monovalent cation:H+ antiporter-2